jgi:hypothetical protein
MYSVSLSLFVPTQSYPYFTILPEAAFDLSPPTFPLLSCIHPSLKFSRLKKEKEATVGKKEKVGEKENTLRTIMKEQEC